MITTQQSYRDIWTEIDNAATTAEQQRCVGEAEENASDTSVEDDGFELHSEDWYRIALMTYEFLIDNGTYAADEEAQMSTEPIDLHDIPGTSAYEVEAAGGLCPACSARWDAQDAAAAWDALTPGERIASRWVSAQWRMRERLADANPANNPPF